MTIDEAKELNKRAKRTAGCKKVWITPEQLLDLSNYVLRSACEFRGDTERCSCQLASHADEQYQEMGTLTATADLNSTSTS